MRLRQILLPLFHPELQSFGAMSGIPSNICRRRYFLKKLANQCAAKLYGLNKYYQSAV
jgi:hypothetical protein